MCIRDRRGPEAGSDNHVGIICGQTDAGDWIAVHCSCLLYTSILLALTGGILDAYTYLTRGGVFANAQTGNIVLLGVYLAQGEYSRAARYVIPIAAFAVGVRCV